MQLECGVHPLRTYSINEAGKINSELLRWFLGVIIGGIVGSSGVIGYFRSTENTNKRIAGDMASVSQNSVDTMIKSLTVEGGGVTVPTVVNALEIAILAKSIEVCSRNARWHESLQHIERQFNDPDSDLKVASATYILTSIEKEALCAPYATDEEKKLCAKGQKIVYFAKNEAIRRSIPRMDNPITGETSSVENIQDGLNRARMNNAGCDRKALEQRENEITYRIARINGEMTADKLNATLLKGKGKDGFFNTIRESITQTPGPSLSDVIKGETVSKKVGDYR